MCFALRRNMAQLESPCKTTRPKPPRRERGWSAARRGGLGSAPLQ